MANNLFVSYDLHRPGQDYERLFAAIHRLGIATRVLYSVWYVNSPHDVDQARSYLAQFIDRNDSLIVVNASNDSMADYNLHPYVGMMLDLGWDI